MTFTLFVISGVSFTLLCTTYQIYIMLYTSLITTMQVIVSKKKCETILTVVGL